MPLFLPFSCRFTMARLLQKFCQKIRPALTLPRSGISMELLKWRIIINKRGQSMTLMSYR